MSPQVTKEASLIRATLTLMKAEGKPLDFEEIVGRLYKEFSEIDESKNSFTLRLYSILIAEMIRGQKSGIGIFPERQSQGKWYISASTESVVLIGSDPVGIPLSVKNESAIRHELLSAIRETFGDNESTLHSRAIVKRLAQTKWGEISVSRLKSLVNSVLYDAELNGEGKNESEFLVSLGNGLWKKQRKEPHDSFEEITERDVSPEQVCVSDKSNFENTASTRASESTESDEIEFYHSMGLSRALIRELELVSSDQTAPEFPVAQNAQIVMESSSYDGLDNLLLSLIESTVADRRDSEALLQWFGVSTGEVDSLASIASRIGVSRERVRQLKERALKGLSSSPECSPLLNAIARRVRNIVFESGGTIELGSLSVILDDQNRWQRSTSPETLARLVPAIISEVVYKKPNLTVPVYHCLSCAKARRMIGILLDDNKDINDALSFSRLYSREMMSTCLTCCTETHQFSAAFIRAIADCQNRIRLRAFNEPVVLSSRQILLQQIENLLLENNRPMHFGEIHSALFPFSSSTSKKPIHVKNLLDHAAFAIKWDRGTYLHSSYSEVECKLSAEIERWLLQKLSEGLPFVMIYGPFTEYRKECDAANITSETGLYSILRRDCMKIKLPCYPFIVTSDARPTQKSMLDDILVFVRSLKNPIPLSKLDHYALNRLCLSQPQYNLCIRHLSHHQIVFGEETLLNWQCLGTHEEKALASLRNCAQEFVSGSQVFSVSLVRNAAQASCHILGIDSDRMLYSLLRSTSKDLFSFPGYPRVLPKQASSGRNLSIDISEHVRGMDICPLSTIREVFVESLGFSDGIVFRELEKTECLWYSGDTLIHPDSLRWSEENQRALESEAVNFFRDYSSDDSCFVLSDVFLEHACLPSIPVPWTRALVVELLCRGHNFIVVADEWCAFLPIPNDHGITDRMDMVGWLIRKWWNGVCEIQEFNERCAQKGLVFCRLNQIKPTQSISFENGVLIAK